MVRFGHCLVVVLICVMLTGAVSAQQMNMDDVKKQLEMVGQLVAIQLNITDTQQNQLGTICKSFKQSCEITANSSESDEAKVAKVQTIADGTIKNAMAVFSEQQKTTAFALGMALLSQHSAGSTIVVNSSDVKGFLTKTGLNETKADAILGVIKKHCESAKLIYANDSLSKDAVKSKLLSLRMESLVNISGKLDADEQKTMAAVLKMLTQNGKTFMSCLTTEQKPKAVALGNQILRFAEETVVIK